MVCSHGHRLVTGLPVQIACVSDTHGMLHQAGLPDADVLVVAGDYCPNFVRGDPERDAQLQWKWVIREFYPWLEALKYKKIIIVSGNHDWVNLYAKFNDSDKITYLQDSGLTYDGVSFYGSPWQPWFHEWAFNFPELDNLSGFPTAKKIWSKIPDKLDVLITHSPPFGIMDLCPDGRRVGCPKLLRRVMEVKPKLHIFGHIHECYGQESRNDIQFVNAALCDGDYVPNRSIQVHELK